MNTKPGLMTRIRRAFAQLRHLAVLGMLLLALLFLEAFVACETEEEEPAVLYGPPPADASGETGADVVNPDLIDGSNGEMSVLYGPQPVDVVQDSLPEANEEMPSVYYGPPPVDVVEDVPPEGSEEISVLYGPQPTDTVDEDVAPEVDPNEEVSVLYGPPIGDVTEPEDEDVMPDTDEEMPAVYYGPQPVDTVDEKADCPPATLYGPPPCDTDEDCQEWYGGENWYCDKENEVDDGCGGTATWPMCKEK